MTTLVSIDCRTGEVRRYVGRMKTHHFRISFWQSVMAGLYRIDKDEIEYFRRWGTIPGVEAPTGGSAA